MISIKFLLVTSLRYKTALLWELGTWSHRFFNNFSLLLLRLTVENLGTRKDASYGVPRAKVAILRLSREEHKYSLAFEKSFRLHCRESPIEAYLKERRRRTRRNIRFRSFFRNLFDSPRRRHLELPKRCWMKTYVRFLISLNKSIELNKIHHYFMCTSFAGRMNY